MNTEVVDDIEYDIFGEGYEHPLESADGGRVEGIDSQKSGLVFRPVLRMRRGHVLSRQWEVPPKWH